MKISIQKYFLLLTVSLLMVGCDPNITSDEEVVAIEPGSADFSNFVAIGDSLTAGYADGALYRDGQVNSYPAILAQQFALAGGGDFVQPLLPEGATGSLTLTGIGDLGFADRLVLVPTGNPASPAAPGTITPTMSASIDVPLAGTFNNMGVPGAKSYHLGATTYGNPAALPAAANPFYVRFASSTGATMIGDAAVQAPSFFVLWIGNNDVLSYATGGGTGVVSPVGPPPFGSEDITNGAVFPGVFGGLLAAINTPTNKGVLVNIGEITAIPYFTTVPFNPIPMDAATADATNAAYADYNAGLLGAEGATLITAEEREQRTISFAAGEGNPLVIEDDSLTAIVLPGPTALPSIRQATAADYVVLPTLPKIGTEAVDGVPTSIWGVGVPLTDEDVLTESEAALVETARTAYNAAIKAAADADPNLLLFDAAAKFAEISANGASYGTGAVYTTFATGGFFSLDGVHPTARGYAVTANEIIKVINEGFGATIPLADPGAYTTVFYE